MSWLHMMEALHKPASAGRYLLRLGRVLRLGAVLAATLTLAVGVGRAGSVLEGELYAVGSRDSERLERVEFNYDGQNFKVARSLKTHNLRGKGDVLALLDSLRSREGPGRAGTYSASRANPSGAFSAADPGGGATLRIKLESWQDAPARPAPTELPEIGGMLSGDDRSLNHVAVEADGSAYYFGEDEEARGTFGVIDLETNSTTRLLDDLPVATDVVEDPLSGELIVIGSEEIVQIQPEPEAHVVSRHDAPPGEALESSVVDGAGHLFVRRTDGKIIFVDYSASGRIGAAGNFTASATADSPVAVDGSGWDEPLPWLEIAAGLAGLLVLVSLSFLIRARRRGRAYGAVKSESGMLDGAGDELVYSRWPEDWSQLKHLVASMRVAERAELGDQLEKNPRMLDDARALIRWPVQGGMSELRGGAAFGAALAGFARDEFRVDWRDAVSVGESDLEIRVAHHLKPGAEDDWSRVIVEASIGGAGQGAMAEQAQRADAAASNPEPVAIPLRRRKRRNTLRRAVGDMAAELGLFDVRGLFNRVSRRLVKEGVATRLDLDAADGLRMSGDEAKSGKVLEGILRATLNSEQGEGTSPPSLAVMAYEDKGEIHFIALRTGTDGRAKRPAYLTGAALKKANELASRDGGRVWVEPGDDAEVCHFTLDGNQSNPVRKQTKKRSGWRPAQSKAVWNMRQKGDSSRF